ncbi:MAG: HTH domain-containing protein [Methanosarcina sp.]
MSAQELAEILEISSRAVEKQIANLKYKGLLKRIGPDKGGYWEVDQENREFNS